MKPAVKTALKWTALAVAGFLLGAGAAFLQQPGDSQDKPPAIGVTKDGMLAKPGDLQASAAKPAEPDAAAEGSSGPPEGYVAESTDITAPNRDFMRINRAREAEKQQAAADAAPEPEPMPPLVSGVKSAFSLTGHDGKPVTEASWPGKYLLVFFGFTQCPDICPVTLDKLTSVMKRLGPDAEKIQPLFITVDPQNDTPAVMKEYVGHFHPSIFGLTGSPDQVKAAQDAFKVYAAKVEKEPNSGNFTFDHSAYVYFMNPDGTMAAIMRTQDKAGEIVDKIKPHLTPAEPPAP